MLAGIFAVPIILGLILWAHDARLRARLFADLPEAGDFIETRGATLHYLSKNTGAAKDKPVFVLIHGSSANAYDMMAALGDDLAAHGTVLSFDRPGRSKLNTVPCAAKSSPKAAIMSYALALEPCISTKTGLSFAAPVFFDK